MISLKWALTLLYIPFLWIRRSPLVRPSYTDWNPSLPIQTVQVEGHTLCYVEKGEGEPLLLIHGFGAGMWVWEKQIDPLSQHYRVFALDLIGHGFSDRPPIGYSAQTYIDCLKGFMNALDIQQATLIGNSMGGGIAWAMTIWFPERVRQLVLIDAMPPRLLKLVDHKPFRTLMAFRKIPFLLLLVIAGRSRRSIRWILQACVWDNQQITSAMIHRQYGLINIRGTTWVLYSTLLHANQAAMFEDFLPLIQHPTLILWGEHDHIFPLSVGESLHQAISGSVFEIIQSSGHIPMWERPDIVNQLLLRFLKQV